MVQALVLELIESNVFRLQLPQATVDVRSDVPLAVGSTVTLAVKGAGANARLVIYADDARPAAPHAASAADCASGGPDAHRQASGRRSGYHRARAGAAGQGAG